MNNNINYAGVSPKVTPAIIRDNVEDIKDKIRRSDKSLLYAVLRNPEPCDTFKLLYKEGTDYYSYLPWYKTRPWNPFAKKNFIYSRNIYSGQTGYEIDYSSLFSLSKAYTPTYRESDLINFIKNKSKNLSWAHYIWCKDKTPKTPVWYNYSIDLVWSNAYNNSSYSTRIYLISSDRQKNIELVNMLNEEFATSQLFKKPEKSMTEVNKQITEHFSDNQIKLNRHLSNQEERMINAEFIKSRVFFLQREIVDIESHTQDFHGTRLQEELKKRNEYYEELVYRIQDCDVFCWDGDIKADDLNYDDYPLKFY